MGSEMLQVTGAGGLGEEASAAQQRGGILVTWSEEKKKKKAATTLKREPEPRTANQLEPTVREIHLLLSG